MGSKRFLVSKYRERRRTCQCLLLLLSVIAAVALIHERVRPVGCGRISIWSHRGHSNAEPGVVKRQRCQATMQELQKNGIHHFDVDVVMDHGIAMVAHPTEMTGTNDTPSPCAQVSFHHFVLMMKQVYGPTGFYFTVEPKASWRDEGRYLEEPQIVLEGILSVLEESPVQDKNCAIILEPTQASDSRIEHLLDRAQESCGLAQSFKRNAAPLGVQDVPSDDYQISMPALELFGGFDGDSFLTLSGRKPNLKTVVWMVETRDQLMKAMTIGGVDGVVSNHPIQVKEMYEEICRVSKPGDSLRAASSSSDR